MQFKNHEDQQAFELWAFGRKNISYDLHIMHEWNSKWGDKVWLKPDDEIKDSLKRMYELYLKESKGAIQ